MRHSIIRLHRFVLIGDPLQLVLDFWIGFFYVVKNFSGCAWRISAIRTLILSSIISSILSSIIRRGGIFPPGWGYLSPYPGGIYTPTLGVFFLGGMLFPGGYDNSSPI